ncbi:MAG: hypothetical protein ACREXR_01250 [Gammaproteobacteria bacterium]
MPSEPIQYLTQGQITGLVAALAGLATAIALVRILYILIDRHPALAVLTFSALAFLAALQWYF